MQKWYRPPSLAEENAESTLFDQFKIAQDGDSQEYSICEWNVGKELIKVQPVVFRTDVENSREFFLDNAEFFIDETKLNAVAESERHA